MIPEAVWREVALNAGDRPGVRETHQAENAGWLRVRSVGMRELVDMLRNTLDAGEAEAIALASETGASLVLIDESDGRTKARSLGLRVSETVGVLLRAKRTGHLPALKPLLNRLVQQYRFRLSRPLLDQVLKEAGEAL